MFERYTDYPPNTRPIFVLTMGSTLISGKKKADKDG